jgi:hypothetical protein
VQKNSGYFFHFPKNCPKKTIAQWAKIRPNLVTLLAVARWKNAFFSFCLSLEPIIVFSCHFNCQ